MYVYLQMIVGTTTPSERAEVDQRKVKRGMMVAVYSQADDQYVRPWIGKVLECKGDNVNVHWFDGDWTVAWKPAYRGRRRDPYTSIVKIQTILLFDFQLNSFGVITRFNYNTFVIHHS